MSDEPVFEDDLTPVTDAHVGGERLHIRHRHERPSQRGGLTLEGRENGVVWLCVSRQGPQNWQYLNLRPEEARAARDWLSAYLDSQ